MVTAPDWSCWCWTPAAPALVSSENVKGAIAATAVAASAAPIVRLFTLASVARVGEPPTEPCLQRSLYRNFPVAPGDHGPCLVKPRDADGPCCTRGRPGVVVAG